MPNGLGFRVGFGYDVHKLVPERPLILGGVSIPFEYGLLGHSDADVLAHAITDAILGAAALGDIGTHFPDTEDQYRDVDSLWLLEQVSAKVRDAGYQVGNIDATVVAQRPRLSPYVQTMRDNLARSMGMGVGDVSVKATTSEGLGFTGRQEGISSYAVALIAHGSM